MADEFDDMFGEDQDPPAAPAATPPTPGKSTADALAASLAMAEDDIFGDEQETPAPRNTRAVSRRRRRRPPP